MIHDPPSVIVVGGGVFGWASAYYLARRGVSVSLFERDAPGAHASGNNPGNLNPIHGAPERLIPLALRSLELHQELRRELAALNCADYQLEPVKRLLLAFDPVEHTQLQEARQAFATRSGFVTSWLDRAAVAALDSRLSAAVQSALLVEGNMSINSGAFLSALAAAAVKLGVQQVRAEVIGVDTLAQRVVGVRSSAGALACDHAVFATGPWTAATREWLGFDAQITPVKGEMLRIALPGPALQYDFTHGMISLYRRGQNECWIGVTREDAGFDESASEAGRANLLAAATRIMPVVAQAAVLQQSAALRPMSRNGLPVVGRVPGWENAYIANGASIKGMLLCSGVGLALAELITNGRTTVPIPELM